MARNTPYQASPTCRSEGATASSSRHAEVAVSARPARARLCLPEVWANGSRASSTSTFHASRRAGPPRQPCRRLALARASGERTDRPHRRVCGTLVAGRGGRAHRETVTYVQRQRRGGLPLIRSTMERTKAAPNVDPNRDGLNDDYRFCNRVAALHRLTAVPTAHPRNDSSTARGTTRTLCETPLAGRRRAAKCLKDMASPRGLEPRFTA